MKKLPVFQFVVVLVFGIIGKINAAHIDRGGGLIYDSYQNITWLQNANYANTSGYDDALYGYNTNGWMFWKATVEWANGLEYYDSIRDVAWTALFAASDLSMRNFTNDIIMIQ